MRWRRHAPRFRVGEVLHSTDDREVNLYGALGYAHARLAAAGDRVRSSFRDSRGQGTVEYVALVLLVSLVMLGVVAAMKTYNTGEGQQLGDLILRKIKEAVGKVRY
jgi:Flp pilus assembly pilin Flp